MAVFEDNLMRMIRMGNIFDPYSASIQSNTINPDLGSPGPMQSDSVSPTRSRMEELYSPETDFSNMYKKSIDEFPTRNKPGLGRKLLASMAGLSKGGQKAADDFLYRPYYEKLEDWKAKNDAIQPGLTLERYNNTNERTLANQTVGRELEAKRIENTAKNQAATQSLNQSKLELARWKASNPNKRAVNGDDGFVHLLDPVSGESIKTEIKHGDLTDLEKINLGLDAALARIDAQGKVTRSNQGAMEAQRQGNRLALENVQQGNRQSLESQRQTGRATLLAERNRVWNLLPTQQKQLIINNFESLIRDNPEYAEFIEMDPDTKAVGFTEAAEGSSGFFGFGTSEPLDPNVKKSIIDRLNQGLTTPRSSSTTVTTFTKMLGPDGKEYNVPTEKVEQAKKDGMKVK